MTINRKHGIIIGALFLLAMAAYMSGNGFITSSLRDGIFESKFKLGIFLEFINSAAVVCIAALIFPILRKQNEWATTGYVAARIVEATLLLIASACAFIPVLIPCNQNVIEAFMGFRNILFQLAMISLGAGSMLFCWVLFKSRMIPRLLSVLGIIGYFALFVSGWIELFVTSSIAFVLFIPGALFELTFPVWLFIKGFNDTRM